MELLMRERNDKGSLCIPTYLKQMRITIGVRGAKSLVLTKIKNIRRYCKNPKMNHCNSLEEIAAWR